MPRMEIGVGEATEKAPHDQPVFLWSESKHK
jgi:hypothetical protein